MLSVELSVGLALTTLRSRPELKSRVRPLTNRANQGPEKIVFYISVIPLSYLINQQTHYSTRYPGHTNFPNCPKNVFVRIHQGSHIEFHSLCPHGAF